MSPLFFRGVGWLEPCWGGREREWGCEGTLGGFPSAACFGGGGDGGEGPGGGRWCLGVLTLFPPGWSRDLHGAPRAIRQTLPRLHHQHLCLGGPPWTKNPNQDVLPPLGVHSPQYPPTWRFCSSSALTLLKGGSGGGPGSAPPARGNLGLPPKYKGSQDSSAPPSPGGEGQLNTNCARVRGGLRGGACPSEPGWEHSLFAPTTGPRGGTPEPLPLLQLPGGIPVPMGGPCVIPPCPVTSGPPSHRRASPITVS